ncbi:pantetheine-phosphate adenylyltransferase [Dissulfurirhabdus thermomarina]|uniref:Phosphopantetheine adenylyltransferase n=1 Tax=Dissulfurirhabdus thermomarina TaxID=1765737 RepID=A0A6N9TJT8_DISTH|nr:pantetheine-phosphate adenylyltransferase [Dissulfurirhabdus thermomarina]NDY41349.1 pantetheine-phosphate adenylyltransferase [Dissulfurirhabdus thermomarina]NMX23268.1 pantetheine-phosphate adenylyltransferase [Dissulfurirhabdus thermomarina]
MTPVPEKVAVYPGTFDPLTNGHLDVIRRGLRLFDRVIVGVGENPVKRPLFTLEERLDMIREAVGADPRVEVDSFGGLLVDFARERGAVAILRGLRAVSDFEYELQRALMNRKLDRGIETVFLMTGFRWIYISSTIVKEAARFGGSLEGLVPPFVETRLRAKYQGGGAEG